MKSKREKLIEVYDFLYGKRMLRTWQEFADLLQVTRPALSAAKNGNEAYLTKNLFMKICATFPGLFNLDYLLSGEGELLAAHGGSGDEDLRTLDQSSLINAALAAKDETIKSKDAYISHLEETIAHLKSEVEFLRRTMQTSHIHTTFPIGVAEDDEKPSLYTPPFPQSPK